jgi:hypothetical protein
MKILLILCSFFLFYQTVSAEPPLLDCDTWKSNSATARVMYADGYRMVIFMALHPPGQKQINLDAYNKAFDAVFPERTLGDFIKRISRYCDITLKGYVDDAVIVGP